MEYLAVVVDYFAVAVSLSFLLCPLIIFDSNFLGRVVSLILAQRAN
jgi:hypothetical protein